MDKDDDNSKTTTGTTEAIPKSTAPPFSSLPSPLAPSLLPSSSLLSFSFLLPCLLPCSPFSSLLPAAGGLAPSSLLLLLPVWGRCRGVALLPRRRSAGGRRPPSRAGRAERRWPDLANGGTGARWRRPGQARAAAARGGSRADGEGRAGDDRGRGGGAGARGGSWAARGRGVANGSGRLGLRGLWEAGRLGIGHGGRGAVG